MITIVKMNVLTDDDSVPADLREKLIDVLRTVIRDDPEGVPHAKVSLEWRHTVHNRGYMETLPGVPGREVISPKKAEKRPAPKRAAKGGP